MSRLTEKEIDYLIVNGEYSEDADRLIRGAAYELREYRKLEEQGRLIERKHGRWIHKDNFIGKYLMCSECSHVTGRKSNYCPNCGAKMDEVAE